MDLDLQNYQKEKKFTEELGHSDLLPVYMPDFAKMAISHEMLIRIVMFIQNDLQIELFKICVTGQFKMAVSWWC